MAPDRVPDLLAEIDKALLEPGDAIQLNKRAAKMLVEALRQSQEALKAARQFLTPGIDRGPAINGWQNTLDMVDEALRGTPSDGMD